MLFGVAAALTLDEFALWLNLRDVYWEREGRESFEALALFGGLLAIGIFGRAFWRGVVAELGALLRLRRIGDEFSFVIFLRHGEQFLHLNRAELLASIRNPVCDRNVVAQVDQQQQCSGDEKQTRPGGLHPFPLLLQSDQCPSPICDTPSVRLNSALPFPRRNARCIFRRWRKRRRSCAPRSKIFRMPNSTRRTAPAAGLFVKWATTFLTRTSIGISAPSLH
jgi:hypothetical protein